MSHIHSDTHWHKQKHKTPWQDKDLKPVDRSVWIFNHLLSQPVYGPGSRVTRLYILIKDMFNQVKAAHSGPWSTEGQRESDS